LFGRGCLFFESPSHPCRPPSSGRVTAFGPGRKYNLLPTLAKNVPPAHFLRVVPIDKGAFGTHDPNDSLPCQREGDHREVVEGFISMKFDQIPRRRTVEDAGPYKEIDSFVFSMKVYQTASVHIAKAELWHYKFISYKAERLVSVLRRQDINSALLFIAPGHTRSPPEKAWIRQVKSEESFVKR